MSRTAVEALKRSIARVEKSLAERPAVRELNQSWVDEKEVDLKVHILPNSRRFPVYLESLQRCTTVLKPDVTGVSLMIGNGVSSYSARYFFYEHFCSLRFRNPQLKYNVALDSDRSQVRIHLDPAISPAREHLDISTNDKMPHQIMDEICTAFAESGASGTSTNRFQWKLGPEHVTSPVEAGEQRLFHMKNQVEELESVHQYQTSETPLEISDLSLEQGEELDISQIFKPIDLLDTENRPPPTNPREELRERRRIAKLERKNKEILTILRARAEQERLRTADE